MFHLFRGTGRWYPVPVAVSMPGSIKKAEWSEFIAELLFFFYLVVIPAKVLNAIEMQVHSIHFLFLERQ